MGGVAGGQAGWGNWFRKAEIYLVRAALAISAARIGCRAGLYIINGGHRYSLS